jgi:hypothetical protein
LVEGIGPDRGHCAGAALVAMMPAGCCKALVPADLDAIVAYLNTVKPMGNAVRTLPPLR